jgi:hypothetical protein
MRSGTGPYKKLRPLYLLPRIIDKDARFREVTFHKISLVNVQSGLEKKVIFAKWEARTHFQYDLSYIYIYSSLYIYKVKVTL